MQFIDLVAQQQRIKPVLDERIARVLAHGQYIMGPEVKELETRLVGMAGTGQCITCSSGSTALDLVLMAWGIGPGDAVFTTPLTFISTAESIARTGATPVFIDIGADYNLDCSQLEQAIQAVLNSDASIYPLPEQAISKHLKPRAIIAVDLFGYPAEYDLILPIAKKYGLKVLEDAAQSFGGTYKNRPMCGLGCDAATTSFFPAKPLGCYGDGGAVFTDDEALAGIVDSLRYHGRIGPQDKNNNIRLGINGRMDTLQAAIVLAKLEIFEDEMKKRQIVAENYEQLLKNTTVVPPKSPVHGVSTWAQYTVLLPAGSDRQKVMQNLKEAGIPTAINYPLSLHRQKAFSYLNYSHNVFPVVEDITARVLSLPMHPYLDKQIQEKIVDQLINSLG